MAAASTGSSLVAVTSRITVFSADGDDPAADLAVRQTQQDQDFWLLVGTRLYRRLRPPLTYRTR